MRESRQVYNSNNKKSGVNPGTRMALDEYREIKEASKPKPRKPRRLIMTDAEQLRIEQSVASRLIETDIRDPKVYHVVRPAAWLWSPA